MKKQELINLGLTEGESKVYLALTKLGSTTVGPIVKEAKVAYSNVYDILDRLLEKGLISYILKQKTRYYQSASPNNFYEYLDKKEKKLQQQRESLKEITKELEKLQKSKPKQEAEIFLGLKGAKTAYSKLYMGDQPKEEYLFFYVYQEETGKTVDKIFADLYPMYKKYTIKGIATEGYKKSKWIKRTKIKMKYTKVPTPGNIDIMGDKVAITTWKGTPVVVLIHSKDIAQKFKDYFYSIWNS